MIFRFGEAIIDYVPRCEENRCVGSMHQLILRAPLDHGPFSRCKVYNN